MNSIKLNNEVLIKIIILLLTLIPMSLVVGVAISNMILFIFFTTSVFFVISIRPVNIFFNLDIIEKIIIIFLFYLFFNLLINSNYENFGRYITFTVFMILTFLFKRFISINQKKMNIYFVFNSVLISFVIIDIIYQFNTGQSIFGYNVYFEERLTGPFKDELVVGSFVVKFFIPIYFFWLYYVKKTQDNLFLLFYFLIFIFIISCIFLTGERSSSLISILAFIMLIVFLNKRIYYFLSFLILFAAGVFLFTSDQYFAKRFQSIFIKTVIDRNYDNNDFLNKSNVYYNLYIQAGRVISSKPITGIGLKRYFSECNKLNQKTKNKKEIFCSNHPHHYLIEILVETGVIGFVIFAIFIMSIFIDSFRTILLTKKTKSINFYIAMGFFISSLAIFLPFRPTGSFFSSWNGLIVWFNIIMLINYTSVLKKERESDSNF